MTSNTLIEQAMLYIDERKAAKLKVAKTDEERAVINHNHEYKVYLDSAAKRASQITLLTHVAKFTHGDSKSSGFSIQPDAHSKASGYLTTAGLQTITQDVAGNAAALDVAGLLQLTNEQNHSLQQEIMNGDSSTLHYFTDDKEQYQMWLHGFGQALQEKSIESSALAKQIFFPVDEKNYHLLSPIHSSSIIHSLYKKVQYVKFSEEQKQARADKRNNKYNLEPCISIPNVAIQQFGGTKPQNISKLNSQRGGKAYLLPSLPPVWNNQLQLPVHGENAFWRLVDRSTYYSLKKLRNFLVNNKNRPSIISMRNYREQLIDEIIDQFILTASHIQADSRELGWSKQSDIPHSEQLWLDPKRCSIDDDFKAERLRDNWKQDISKRFARWLNTQLGFNNSLELSDPEYDEWYKLVKRKLAFVDAMIEV